MLLSLNIGKIKKSYGFLEMLYAFLPILSPYSLGFIPFTILLPVVFSILAFVKTHRVWIYKPYLLLVGYLLLHDLILCMTMPALPMYHLNLLFTTTIVLLSPIFIVPALDFKKLYNSLLFVALICGIGMVYHYIIIRNGGMATPIKIPFLPVGAESRLNEELGRPLSFFVEPASYATFMIVPLFLCLLRDKHIYTTLILITLFLSTSTTAVVESIIVIVIYLLTVVSRQYKLRALILSIMLIAVGYFIQSSALFEATFQKIDDTEINENARIMNGPAVVQHLPIENFLFGVNNANVSDYVTENHLQSFVFYGRDDDHYLFVATFWQILIRFGLPGIFLYIFLFYSFYKKDKTLLPYIFCLATGWFFQGIAISLMFTWQICIMAIYIYRHNEITFEFFKVVKETRPELPEQQ